MVRRQQRVNNKLTRPAWLKAASARKMRLGPHFAMRIPAQENKILIIPVRMAASDSNLPAPIRRRKLDRDQPATLRLDHRFRA